MSRIAACIAGVVVLRTTVLLMEAAATPTAAAAAMSQAEGAYISGRVVSAGQNSLGGARVQLVSSGVRSPSSSVLTSTTGEFVFANLEPGRYWLRADRMGWQAAYFGQTAPQDEAHSIVLAVGERRTGLEIVLGRLAVIVGRVADEFGEPIEGAVVAASGVDVEIARTNDIGEFRIPRVRPGSYVVSATTSIREQTADGVDRGQGVSAAVSVEVNSGGEFSVGELVIVSGGIRAVQGRVIGSTGAPVANADVLLLQEQAGTRASFSSARAATNSSSTGDFHFRRIAEGRYRVKATHADRIGFADIVVAGNDLDGVTVSLQTASTITGRLTTETGSECRDAVVRALPLDAAGADDRAPVEARVTNGQFSLPPLVARQQLEVRCTGDQVAEVVRITLDGGRRIDGGIIDTAQLPERARMTVDVRPLMTRVSGTVVDGSSRPGEGLAVLVDSEIDHWRAPFQYVWIARVDAGAFAFSGIPKGRYHVIHEPARRARTEVESPQYLRSVIRRRGTTIDVREGAPATVSLRIP